MERAEPRRNLWLLPLAGVLTACGAPTLTLQVQSADVMNQGRPLYMLVRNVDQKTFLTESYQTVASQVVTPDASVIDSEVIFPGSSRRFEVSRQSKTPVAVYFLFTSPAPGTDWKHLIDQPLPAQQSFALGTNAIEGPDRPPRPTSPVATGTAPPPPAKAPAAPAAPSVPKAPGI
jgi:hypothetical protein